MFYTCKISVPWGIVWLVSHKARVILDQYGPQRFTWQLSMQVISTKLPQNVLNSLHMFISWNLCTECIRQLLLLPLLCDTESVECIIYLMSYITSNIFIWMKESIQMKCLKCESYNLEKRVQRIPRAYDCKYEGHLSMFID